MKKSVNSPLLKESATSFTGFRIAQASAGLCGILCGLTLVVLAETGTEPVLEEPESPEQSVALLDGHLDKTPPRDASAGLSLQHVSWSYNCMECHKQLEAKWTRDYTLSEHGHIKLEHGNNRFCLNCHHPENRAAYVDYDGTEIPGESLEALCAKCHGTTFREWQAGAHGRESGFWDSAAGKQERLLCNQCHDPHRPKFQPMKPLAPPTYPARAAHPGSVTAEASHPHE